MILPVLSKTSKFKSNKFRPVPLVVVVDDNGNDVKRSVLEIKIWLAEKPSQVQINSKINY